MAERPVLVSLEDVLAAGWHCPHCGTVYSVPIEKLDRALPGSCANCNETLASDTASDQSDHKILGQLVHFLKVAKQRPFGKNLRLQIVQELEKKT